MNESLSSQVRPNPEKKQNKDKSLIIDNDQVKISTEHNLARIGCTDFLDHRVL